jgi:hypothetical protein
VLKTYAFGENEGVGREYGVASLKINTIPPSQMGYNLMNGYKIKCMNTFFSGSGDTLVCESSCGIEEAQTG